jgi:hypothetical protein
MSMAVLWCWATVSMSQKCTALEAEESEASRTAVVQPLAKPYGGVEGYSLIWEVMMQSALAKSFGWCDCSLQSLSRTCTAWQLKNTLDEQS